MYLVKDKNTLSARAASAEVKYDSSPDSAHIIPGKLYPAVNGMRNHDSQYTFTDSSSTGHDITLVGQTHHIGNPKIGSTSIRIDADDYMTVPAHADFNFGTSDFCVELWFKGAFRANGTFWAFGASGEYWICYQEAANKIRVTMGTAGTRQWDTTSSPVWSDDAWHHLAMTKTGTTARFYVDGVEETTINATYTATPAASINFSSLTMGIGAYVGGGQPAGVCNFDEMRVSNHIRYTGNFTPSTTAFVSDSNTKFLLHSDNGGNSGAYGTAQADDKKYYYTDIKGSKPIKDPRIGAHFGSHRHMLKHSELLEQETVTHGKDVYSVDGREWIRAVDVAGSLDIGVNDANGQRGLQFNTTNTGSFYEATGYFNDVNTLVWTRNDFQNDMDVYVDGLKVVDGSTTIGGRTTVASPLAGRFVDASSVVNTGVNQTLGIHTIKFLCVGASYWIPFGIELIAQDTTSTATKSQIQIPSQNVVSFGKKFTIEDTPHYNPFAFAGDGTTAVTINSSTTNTAKVADGWVGSTATYFDSFLDTATSLGLSAWESGGDFFRPVNGGRVVWWVNSSGSLKCSVNMMPPAGTAIGGVTSGHNVPTAIHNWATKYQPALYSTTIDHSQAEVAKKFHWREFGNGAANGGTGAAYADASMLLAEDDIAYVMDDGLTSFSGNGKDAVNSWYRKDAASFVYLTFIGTGITVKTGPVGSGRDETVTYAQNLPYGTHILKKDTPSTITVSDIFIDGVALIANYANDYIQIEEITYHQPKRPPIPEDAVVIADYMLMADHVVQTDCEPTQISKGVRFCSGSRDHFVDVAGGSLSGGVEVMPSSGANGAIIGGITGFSSPGSTHTGYGKLPFFGTNAQSMMQNSHVAGYALELGGVGKTETILDSSVDGHGDMIVLADDQKVTLGQTSIKTTVPTGGYRFLGSMVASPIHTSSHYQAFETPFLHELVGGDRNMEQTNLVVTPDGKTWDEVTRDTSYIGNIVHQAGSNASYAEDVIVIMDDRRGVRSGALGFGIQKDFACAYDRDVCLRAGQYAIHTISVGNSPGVGGVCRIYINGVHRKQGSTGGGGYAMSTIVTVAQLDRGDYVQVKGKWHGNHALNSYWIERC